MAQRRTVRLLTFATRVGGYSRAVEGLAEREKFPTWITPLEAGSDELRRSWKQRSNNLFRNIAKAERNRVTVREGKSKRDLKAFYRLYLETMKRHHSLPRSWTQISLDMRLLAPRGISRLFLAEHERRIVAAGLFHAMGEELVLLYAGSSTSERALRGNFALYWEVIRWAAENGYRHLDWGEAKDGSTLARFKAQWSADRVKEYVYEYILGDTEAAARVARLRHVHDDLDTAGGTNLRERLTEAVWDRTPPAITAAAGTLAYRIF